MLTEGWTSTVLEDSCHQVHDRELCGSPLAGVLLKISAGLEGVCLKWTGGHRERIGVERRPLDLRLELFPTCPQLGRTRHPQTLVVNHLVLWIGDLDLFGSAQQSYPVDIYICISQ